MNNGIHKNPSSRFALAKVNSHFRTVIGAINTPWPEIIYSQSVFEINILAVSLSATTCWNCTKLYGKNHYQKEIRTWSTCLGQSYGP